MRQNEPFSFFDVLPISCFPRLTITRRPSRYCQSGDSFCPIFLCYTRRMSETFKRVKENFTCGHCGKEVQGNGYTNHCPSCLWSKHVDVYPGDRAAVCRALMEPTGTETRGGEYVLVHRCTTCGHEQKNKAAKEDDRDALLSCAPSSSKMQRR